MRRNEQRIQKTVAGLLSVENRSLIGRLRSICNHGCPQHIYVYCASKNIALRFLSDAKAEGFTYGDGASLMEKKYSDIYLLNPDFTISYSGWAGHVIFKNNGGGNVFRIDYGKYISDDLDFIM